MSILEEEEAIKHGNPFVAILRASRGFRLSMLKLALARHENQRHEQS